MAPALRWRAWMQVYDPVMNSMVTGRSTAHLSCVCRGKSSQLIQLDRGAVVNVSAVHSAPKGAVMRHWVAGQAQPAHLSPHLRHSGGTMSRDLVASAIGAFAARFRHGHTTHILPFLNVLWSYAHWNI